MSTLILAIIITGLIVAGGRFLSKKSTTVLSMLMAAIWLAVGMGWWAGGWLGILAITMPSILVLVVGLLALPPFVLPVPPLRWKEPALVAILYLALWLLATGTGRLDMNIVNFWLCLQGSLLILRFSFPIDKVGKSIAYLAFFMYGLLVFAVWRVFRGFGLTQLNLLILVQGLMVLSCYVLPSAASTQDRMWILMPYGLFCLAVLGIIEVTLTNSLILLLGIAALAHYLVHDHDNINSSPNVIATFVLLGFHVMTWGSMVVVEELALDLFTILAFSIGLAAIFIPVFLRPSGNWRAFKAIITYNLGTNYPYKAVVGRKAQTRADGNPFAEEFAGPGIILTNADHVVVIYGGGRFKRVAPPGLTFTDTFEVTKEFVDLRVQLRARPPIKAKTKDGIEVSIPVFTPMQIAKEEGQELELGNSFPYDPKAVRKAVHVQHVDQDSGEKLSWDKLIRQQVEQIMRDIISEYELDELCGLEPRLKIATAMKEKVQEFIKDEDLGIELIGGGVGNIMPEDEIVERRIEHWKAHWESHIKSQETRAEAIEADVLEKARAEAKKELLLEIAKGLEPWMDSDPDMVEKLMVFSLIESIFGEEPRNLFRGFPIFSQMRATAGLDEPTARSRGTRGGQT